MKKIYKIKFLNKLAILTYFLLVPVFASSADLETKKWNKKCIKENKGCVSGILFNKENTESDQIQTLATIYIRLGSTTEKKMDLVDGKEKTYKLKEVKTTVPVLFANLPLNVDLTKQPLIQIDGKDVFNLTFSHCNKNEGCVTRTIINDKIINLFKSGKNLNLVMAGYQVGKNMTLKLPLKGFSKSYESLLK
tara:strand:- start:325 stop:900 length:576 start_codon:yes stop_codon:yes gene_type:complete